MTRRNGRPCVSDDQSGDVFAVVVMISVKENERYYKSVLNLKQFASTLKPDALYQLVTLISPRTINTLVSAIETERVYSAVRTESLNITQPKFDHQRIRSTALYRS